MFTIVVIEEAAEEEVSGMNTEYLAAPPLFVPPDAKSSHCVAFLKKVNEKYGLALDSYFDLYRWSTHHIELFWDTVWDDVAIVGYKGKGVVDNNALPAANPPWFSEARLNWAENMLTCRSADKFALIQATEPTPECPNPPHQRVTYADLYAMVADLVSALLMLDLKPGDRVASYSSNCIENVIACLAATAIGRQFLTVLRFANLRRVHLGQRSSRLRDPGSIRAI